MHEGSICLTVPQGFPKASYLHVDTVAYRIGTLFYTTRNSQVVGGDYHLFKSTVV